MCEGFLALAENHQVLNLRLLFTQHWGSRVGEYLERKQGANGEEWVWKDISQFWLTVDQHCLMQDIFATRRVLLNRGEDRWCGVELLMEAILLNLGLNFLILEGRKKYGHLIYFGERNVFQRREPFLGFPLGTEYSQERTGKGWGL